MAMAFFVVMTHYGLLSGEIMYENQTKPIKQMVRNFILLIANINMYVMSVACE